MVITDMRMESDAAGFEGHPRLARNARLTTLRSRC